MILMYHKVDIRSPTMWWVDVSSFYRQMCFLKDRNVVYLDDYDPNDPSHVVITFDGIYSNVLLFAAPILSKFRYPFELFVSYDLIGAENEFDLVEPPTRFASNKELAELLVKGGRLQWHTRTHPMLSQCHLDRTWGAVEDELSVPEELRDADPSGLKWFAYPYGEFSDDVYEAVKERFAGAVSCSQGNDMDIHKLNRITVTNSSKLQSKSICAIIVSHNYGRFLSEAVESVLQQTILPDRILIMDDASEDETCAIGKRYADLYPELIAYARNEQNLGIVGTFNAAVQLTSSEFVCFLGADNRLSANYIELCIVTLLDGKASIAYTDFRLFGTNAQDEYFKHEADRRGRIIDEQFYEIVFPEFRKGSMLTGSFMHGSSMYSRAAFDQVGGYLPRREGRPEDANLFRRMINAGHAAQKVAGAWLEYRQHSVDQANIVSRTQGELAFYRAYARRLEFKVKALEASFGLLSPVVRIASLLEKAAFEFIVRVVRIWRRRFR